MDTLTIPVVVGTDRRLVIDLPSSTPVGPAEVVVRPRASGSDETGNPERDTVRAKLLAANFLTTDIHVPEEAVALSAEDIADLGRLPPDARPSEVLVDEDRGSY
jgi:hypothetical protein